MAIIMDKIKNMETKSKGCLQQIADLLKVGDQQIQRTGKLVKEVNRKKFKLFKPNW